MNSQTILSNRDDYAELDGYLQEKGYRNILLVSGKSFYRLKLSGYFAGLEDRLGIKIHYFNDIRPNPLYEGILEGMNVFRENGCDCIIAVGGGSPMDTAKCIKTFMYMDESVDYLKQEIVPNDIPFIAIPTTAGTGSEATRFAIIYKDGQKVTVTDESSIPQAVLFDPGALKTLDDYQRKATMLDALSHAVESYWAVKATDESRGYADEAIRMFVDAKDSYLANEEEGNRKMLMAAYTAGKAINITQTTAGHAMCYKLTTLYGLAHGHSVSLVMRRLYPYILSHTEDSNDPRGSGYLNGVLEDIAGAMGKKTAEEGCQYYVDLVRELEMPVPKMREEDFDLMVDSVNPERLRNNPVSLDRQAIAELYIKIFD
ncbi:MAG: phosphonoacetaldehyde reductase [Erysipelotrichaceae bacterium]|nr:phosphonoacetaldehyde reductase [Erysipelotrichaceae bacterium]